MFLYLARQYLLLIFFILLALQVFFVSIDSLKYLDSMPSSANLIILFFTYDFLYAINYTFPISILLAGVVFYLNLIRSNQYMAFLALGYSKKQILSPVLCMSTLLIFFYMGLNATPFAYAQEKAESIIYQGNFSSITEDLLVKYQNNYVYFQKIYPLIKRAENIKAFELDQNNSLLSLTQANETHFIDGYWVLDNAVYSKIPKQTSLGKMGLEVSEVKQMKILKGFRPKILDTIYQNKPSVSITDAIQSLLILKNQDANYSKIRALLYNFIFVPFFIPMILIVIAFYSPMLGRYSNLSLLGFGFVVICLVAWGLFFALGRLSISGLLPPELVLLVPLLILLFFSVFFYFRMNSKI